MIEPMAHEHGRQTGLKIPHDEQAEVQLLSALLLQPTETMPRVIGTIEPKDFYRPAHGLMYGALIELVEEGVRPDAVTLSEKLDERGELAAVGGPAEVMAVAGCMSGYSSNAERYASIITNAARRRDLMNAAAAIQELAAAQWDSGKAASGALELVQEVVDATNGRVRLRSMTEMVDEYMEVLGSRSEGKGLGIQTGWRDLDEIVQGMRPGQLWVCGAPPKTGKSTFAGNLAMNVLRQGRRVLLVSVEMAVIEVMERMMAAEARVDMKRLRVGNLTTDHWASISMAAADMADLQLAILDDTNASLLDVRACARRTKAELVIIDYTQLLKAEVRKGGTREQVVAELTAGMKRLARELEIPVLALSQVRREAADQRPGLTDFAESSSFEKNADYLLGLYRDELVNEASADRGTIEVIVIASRHTETGTAKLAYLGHYQKISDMARVEVRDPSRAFNR